MSAIRLSNSGPYILSLDNLDFHISSNPYKCSNETVPLWSKGKELYYEFEIITDSEDSTLQETLPDKVVVNNDDLSLPPGDNTGYCPGSPFFSDDCEKLEKVMCHICNVQVPCNFISEHHQGKKHKIYTELAEAAVQRIMKNMNNFVEYKEKSNTKYSYCDVCSMAVEDKTLHETTNQHLKALENYDKINLLLKLYNAKDPGKADLDDEKNDIENENDNKEKIKLINKQDDLSFNSVKYDEITKPFKKFHMSIYKGDRNNNNSRSFNHKINLNKPEKSIKNESLAIEDAEINENTKISSEEKDHNGSIKCNDTETKTAKLNDDNYKFDISNYFMQNTDAVNDNAQSSNEPWCVDATTETGGKEFQEYISDMIEMYRLNEPVPKVDGNSILIYSLLGREQKVSVDNFQSFVKSFRGLFCILCQMQINDDVGAHLREKEHVLNILKPIDEHFTRKMNDHCSHCIICNKLTIDVEQHSSMDPEHTQILNPTNTLINKKKDAVNTLKHPTIPKYDIPKYMKTHKQRNFRVIFCNICDVDVTYNIESVKDHCENDPTHIENVDKLLNTDMIIPVEFGHKCKACNIVYKDILPHLVSLKHYRNRQNCCQVCFARVPQNRMPEHVRIHHKPEKTEKEINNTDSKAIKDNAETSKKAKVSVAVNKVIKKGKKTFKPSGVGSEQYFSQLFEHAIAEVLDSHWMVLGYKCDACDKNLKDYSEHIKTTSHLNKLTSYKKCEDLTTT